MNEEMSPYDEVKKNSILPFVILGTVFLISIVVVIAIVFAKASPEEKAAKELELARQYLDEMEYVMAVAHYTKAIDIDPKNADAYAGLADTYVAMAEEALSGDDVDDAMNYYQKAIDVLEDALNNVDEKDWTDIKRRIAIIRERIDQMENGTYEAGGFENYNYDSGDDLSIFDRLCLQGDTGNMLQWEDVTVLGVSPEEYEFDGWVSYAKSLGYVDHINESDSDDYRYWTGDNSSGETFCVSQSDYEGGYVLTIDLNPGYDSDMTAFCGIPFGRNDSSGDILEKLGMNGGNEIMNAMEAMEFNSEDEWPDASWSNEEKYPGYRLKYLTSASFVDEEGTRLTYEGCGRVTCEYRNGDNIYMIVFPNDANTADYKLWEISITCNISRL